MARTSKKAMGGNPLGNNALFKPTGNEPEEKKEEQKPKDKPFSPEQVEQIREASSPVDDFTTMTFKVRKEYLKTLRDYAFTNRLEVKEALDEALEKFISGIDKSKLMEYPEKPKKNRKKRS